MPQRSAPLLVVLLLAGAACDRDEPGCAASGGTVVSRSCCKSAPPFPNTCLIGACGCSPENSAPVEVCECPANTCFDGRSCAPYRQVPSR